MFSICGDGYTGSVNSSVFKSFSRVIGFSQNGKGGGQIVQIYIDNFFFIENLLKR